MVSADRQQVIETNRSLRNIKNELESLLEKGVITESAFDSIQRLLPAENSLSHTTRAPGLPTPAATPSHISPPTYAQSTGNSDAAPPPLPGRKQPPPAPPSKPVVAHCKALYAYAAQDSRDCSFEKGDLIAVFEKMNADWWLGQNQRTMEEGIFPKAYVEEEAAGPAQWGEKSGAVGAYGGSGNGTAYPPPPGVVNPYNAYAPPMAMANGGYGGGGGEEKPSKTEENTKKFGKKLGNAAIFGAGATIGGKIVNSIF